MILLAILGIVVNGLGVYKTTKGKSLNEKVISLHLLEDVLGWVAVFIVSIVMIFTDLYILDPILSILIALYILYGVINNLKKTVVLFLQASPENIDTQALENTIKEMPEIYDVHDTHIWSLDGEYTILTMHIIINDTVNPENFEKIKKEVKSIVEKNDIQHSTIEIEYKKDTCGDYCE